MASRLRGELKGREQEQYVVKSTIVYPIAHSPFPATQEQHFYRLPLSRPGQLTGCSDLSDGLGPFVPEA